MSNCKCDLRTRLVGDGCQHCNPTLHAELLEEKVADLEAEIARLRLTDAEREAIQAATRIIDAYDEEMDGFSSGAAATLRALLARLG